MCLKIGLWQFQTTRRLKVVLGLFVQIGALFWAGQYKTTQKYGSNRSCPKRVNPAYH